MKKAACIALASLLLSLSNAVTGLAGDPYYPYQSYDDYYKAHSSQPPPSQPPASSQPPPEQVKPPLQARQPITITEPPEILFPPKLGFGVAVAVPYDLFYVSGAYYFLQGDNTWFRASSYRGPWTLQGLSRLPPELRKHKLAKIHQIRNEEFQKFWKDRSHYQGRHFRAGDEVRQPGKGIGEDMKAD